VLCGTLVGQRLTFGSESPRKSKLLIGSDVACAICLPEDEGVGACHAAIEIYGDSCFIRDAGNGSGTFVKAGVDELACPLWVGDTLVFERPTRIAQRPPSPGLASPRTPSTSTATLLRFHPLEQPQLAAAALGTHEALDVLAMRLERASDRLLVWPRVAVSVHHLPRSCHIYRELPSMLGLKRATIGRHRTKSLIPLPDIKSKKKHARLVVPAGLPGDIRRRLPAGALHLIPYKGKPVLHLLGRADHRHHPPHRLAAGDVFAVGLSLVRVLYFGIYDHGASPDSHRNDQGVLKVFVGESSYSHVAGPRALKLCLVIAI
jgi:hypothetical protein